MKNRAGSNKGAFHEAGLFLLAVLAASIFGCATAGAQGKAAPDFEVGLIGGGKASLSQYKGRPLVLNVSASWCPHCITEIPALKKVYDERSGDAEFLVIFVKSPKKDVESLIKKNALKFKVGFDPDAVVGKAYGVRGIPATFFINRAGEITDTYTGSITERELGEKIDTIK
ncbi:MAG TPA: TlpA disulfide reductase family protein [Nitrospirota bacterium]|nr:TlpA disulfide reductase family protein [Nitrospirota bacterium]